MISRRSHRGFTIPQLSVCPFRVLPSQIVLGPALERQVRRRLVVQRHVAADEQLVFRQFELLHDTQRQLVVQADAEALPLVRVLPGGSSRRSPAAPPRSATKAHTLLHRHLPNHVLRLPSG